MSQTQSEPFTVGHRFRNWYIPARMMPGILRYVEHGEEPGSFLCAIIDNDLTNAVGRADDENIGNLPAFVDYFYNHADSRCWGSPQKRKAWIAKHERATPERVAE